MKRLLGAALVAMSLALPASASAAWQTDTYVSGGWIGRPGFVQTGVWTARTFNFMGFISTNNGQGLIGTDYNSWADPSPASVWGQSNSISISTGDTSRPHCGRAGNSGDDWLRANCQTNNNFG